MLSLPRLFFAPIEISPQLVHGWTMSPPTRPALFLDRDGIFNEVIFRNGVLTSPRNLSEVRLYPNMERLSEAKQMGYALILITNQPCVETGEVTVEFLQEFHSQLRAQYALDAMYFCPHADRAHPLRKPNPGMFQLAAKEHQIRLADSFHLGDTEKDTLAAANCGATSILWDRPYNQGVKADHRIASIEEVLQILAQACP